MGHRRGSPGLLTSARRSIHVTESVGAPPKRGLLGAEYRTCVLRGHPARTALRCRSREESVSRASSPTHALPGCCSSLTRLPVASRWGGAWPRPEGVARVINERSQHHHKGVDGGAGAERLDPLGRLWRVADGTMGLDWPAPAVSPTPRTRPWRVTSHATPPHRASHGPPRARSAMMQEWLQFRMWWRRFGPFRGRTGTGGHCLRS